jgi:dTDP-4-amino-4,6-dideoxygalactose transaminase
MNIPFLDLKAQYQSIRDEVNPAIQNVLDNTAYILGKPVSEFESAFAKAHDVKHAIGVSSGTDGNHLALWALGLKPADEVIIPADTFIATAWGATLCGATPVFVDCESTSYNIDSAKVEEKITSKTKAIVAVHLYGQPADVDPLLEIAKRHKIHFVEDCAQAHLAEYKGKKIGGLSEVASFSFYPGKNLGAYGEAGAVTTNDEALAVYVRTIRDHGAVQKYNHEVLGHNYRMEGIQGAVLGVKLKYLNEWTEKRRVVASKYRERLSTLEHIILPQEMPYAKHVYHLFVIQTRAPSGSRKTQQNTRDALMKYLNEHGVATGLHYPIPLHAQPCFRHLGYAMGDFPVTEQLSENGLSLPMYAEMTDEQINYVCDTVQNFYKR